MKNINRVALLGALAVGALGLMNGRLLAASHTHWLHDEGRIQNIDRSWETFTLLDPRQAVLGIEYNHFTRFYDEHGVPITTRDLKPGERVSVTYEKEGDLLIPKTVRVLPSQNQVARQS